MRNIFLLNLIYRRKDKKNLAWNFVKALQFLEWSWFFYSSVYNLHINLIYYRLSVLMLKHSNSCEHVIHTCYINYYFRIFSQLPVYSFFMHIIACIILGWKRRANEWILFDKVKPKKYLQKLLCNNYNQWNAFDIIFPMN